MADVIGRADYQLGVDKTELVRGLRDVDAELRKTGTTGERAFRGLGGAVGDARSKLGDLLGNITPLTGALGLAGGLAGAVGLVSGALSKAAQNERFAAQLEVLLGTARAERKRARLAEPER